MREIWFKAKRKDNGKWVEGYYAKVKDYLTESDVHVIFPLDTELFPHGEFSGTEEIIPETLCQYTGINDKNNKKVLEGDILKQKLKPSDTYILKVVKYEMSCGSCCTQVIGFGASGNGHVDFIHLDEPFEIIGNIYDNNDLKQERKQK
jgi:uncharacterized phage protein (TIGR01671 family)